MIKGKKNQLIDQWSFESFSFHFQIVVVWNNVKKAPPSGKFKWYSNSLFGFGTGGERGSRDRLGIGESRDTAMATALASHRCGLCN